jgi:ribosomal protein S18 acetylase RimI-like enzyme
MTLAVRPFAEDDAQSAADVLFVAALDRATRTRGPAAFEVPAVARRVVDRFREVDPAGGFVVTAATAVVGMGWTHARGRVATIGPLAVLPRYREHGAGRLLLEACMGAAGARGGQVRMVEDGTDVAAIGLALRCGFRIVTSVLELERLGASPGTEPAASTGGASLRWMAGGDEAEVVARDTRAWGASRPAEVRALLAQGIGAVLERHDRILAHAFARRGAGAVWLGPAAGEDGALVATLLAQLATEAVRGEPLPIRVLVPAGDRRFVDALLAQGFRVRTMLQYLVAGGGTAPPLGYALCSRLLA